MSGIRKLSLAVAIASAVTLGAAGTAHAQGGNGKSFCSIAGGDIHLGQTFINEVRNDIGGFSGEVNPGVLFQGFSSTCRP